MPFELIVDVVRMVVGIVVEDLAELKSQGCWIYRGDAAQISVDGMLT